MITYISTYVHTEAVGAQVRGMSDYPTMSTIWRSPARPASFLLPQREEVDQPGVSNLPQTIMPSAYSPDTLLIHVCLMVDKWECGIHITSMMSGAYVGRGTCVVLRSIRIC